MSGLVDELAYLVLDVIDVEAWERFAAEVLGAGVEREGASLKVRLDARPFRYLIRRGPSGALPALGWLATSPAALSTICARLSEQGLTFAPIGATDCAERRADAGVSFVCRNGIRHEVVLGLGEGARYQPSGKVSGFVTGAGGLGHVVWGAPDLEAMDALMIGAFEMALRENISTPSGIGHFYGCNPRHHSLATFTAPALRLEHVMVEMSDLDDVGEALDRAIDGGYVVSQPMGRHRTDHMVSGYVEAPGGLGVEIGCGGVLCGDDWADVREANRRRPWGHGAAMRRHHKAAQAAAD